LGTNASSSDRSAVICRAAPSPRGCSAWSKSNSPSLKCLIALRRFFGNTSRCEDASTAICVAGIGFIGDGEASRTISVEKRSGVACSPGSRPMAGDHAAVKTKGQAKLRKDWHVSRKFTRRNPKCRGKKAILRRHPPARDAMLPSDPRIGMCW
jgi:hypothetical protein